MLQTLMTKKKEIKVTETNKINDLVPDVQVLIQRNKCYEKTTTHFCSLQTTNPRIMAPNDKDIEELQF